MTDNKKEKTATSLNIDKELWKQAKVEAIKHDMELSELVDGALRKEVEALRKLDEVK